MKKQKDIEEELEKKYGKLILKSFAQYYGGYKPKIAGGVASPHNEGIMYLFKKNFVFRADVIQKSNSWEIVIPIESIIIDDWSPNDESDSKNLLIDSVKVVEDVERNKRLVIPFVDKDGVLHGPEFGITRVLAPKKAVGAASYIGGGGIKKWMEVFYSVIIENHKNKLQVKAQIFNQKFGNKEQYDIKKWIEEGEGVNLEFKSKDILSDGFKIVRTMVAFGNNRNDELNFGGRIVIGINDKTHEIEGVDFDSKHEEFIMNIARDKCVPPISPIFTKIDFEKKTLYVITIPKMTSTPFRLKTSKGMVHFIRVGSTIREPDSTEMAKLYNKLTAQSVEDTRGNQILNQLLDSFKDLREKMKMLQSIAKSKELMITQNRESLDRKNNLIDKMIELIQNPLTVIDEELKSEILLALQKSRYRPAYEAMDFASVSIRQRKMLENGWSKESPDFNVNTRMVDNGTEESLEALENIIKKLTKI